MRPKRTALLTIAAFLLAAAATGLAPGEALAKTKKILPSSFQEGKPHVVATDYVRTPGYIEGGDNAEGALFVAPVRLPVGARITTVKMSAEAAAGNFIVFFGRKKFAGPEEGLLFQTVLSPGAAWQLVDLPLNPGADRVVRAGYTYYVAVTLGTGTRFGGIQVGYR